MKQHEIKNILNHIESNFRVNEWIFNDIEIWPLLRIRLWYAFAYQALNVSNQESIQHQSKLKQIRRVALSPFEWLYNSFRDIKRTYFRIPAGDIVILGDGVSFTKINGRYFDKFADSITEVLNKRSIHSIRLDTTDEYLTPRYYPSFFIQPLLDAINLRSLLEAKIKKPNISMPDYDEVYAYADSLGEAHVFNVQTIQLRAVKVDRLAKYFQKVLKNKQFRAAMSVCYYSDFGFALNLASHRLGIKSFDLQHGVQGKNHGAYGSWQNVPQQGYKVLPDYFLVWSSKEKENLASWSASLSKHGAIITGNLLATVWKSKHLGFDKSANDFSASLKEGKPRILLTLSWDVSSEEHIGNVLEVIRNSQNAFIWLIRLHPSMLNEQAVIEQMLSTNGIVNYEIEGSTNLPLFSVLQESDLHITHSSTCVIEASYFHVKSIIISDYGWSLLSEQVDTKWTKKALLASEIQEELDRHFALELTIKESGVIEEEIELNWVDKLTDIIQNVSE